MDVCTGAKFPLQAALSTEKNLQFSTIFDLQRIQFPDKKGKNFIKQDLKTMHFRA